MGLRHHGATRNSKSWHAGQGRAAATEGEGREGALDSSGYLDAHGQVGAVLELVAARGELPARGVDGGEGVGVVGGGVELPDLAADVRVLGAQPRVGPALRDLQPPHLSGEPPATNRTVLHNRRRH